MTSAILDTSAYSALLRGFPPALETARNIDQLVVTPVVLGELRSGFLKGSLAQQNERDLREFLERPRVRVVGIDEETSVRYSLIKSQLRKSGTPIPSNDVWIAASAAQHGLPVVTLDKHFGHVAAIEVKRLTDTR